MMENIFWAGFSTEERYSAINKIQSTISRYGDIVDVHFFSDLSLNITIEIEEYKIDRLYDEIIKIISIQYPKYLNSNSKKERKIYLNITFSKGTGTLLKEVPSVPG